MSIENYLGTSVSHATLRPQDLIETFEEVLNNIAPEALVGLKETYPEDFVTLLGADADQDTWMLAWEYLDTLCTALEGEAPEGYYFGALEGDASDFGFWPLDPDYIF